MNRTLSRAGWKAAVEPEERPGGPGDPRRPAAGRPPSFAVRIAVTAAAVVLVVWAAWNLAWVRAASAQADPRMVKYLYVALGLLTIGAAARAAFAPAAFALPWWLRPWTGPAGLVGCMAAFCVPLFAAWHTGLWWGMIGGGVPYSDPHIYFGGAERLLFFGDLDFYNSRRPMNAMFLAVRLAVTHLDLRLALVLGALAAGAATFLAARAVARDLGPVPGFALFVGIYGFAKVYGPTPMTEVLGLTFGALAFAALWHAVRDRSRWLAVGGIALATVALDVRAGAVLLPVALAIWLARHLRRSGRYDWRLLGAFGLAVVVATSLNYVAVAGLGGHTDNVVGNGGFLVYGMAKGVPSWNVLEPAWHEVLKDYPQTWHMSDPERNSFVNAKARAMVLAHPWRFVDASVQSERYYLAIAEQEVLLDIPAERRGVELAIGLAVVMAVVARVARGQRYRELLVDLGLFASMVFVVPMLVSFVPSNTPPRWVAPALLVTAFVAFLVVGARRLADAPHVTMALLGVGAMAVCAPLLGVDSVRVFAATAAFAAPPLALAVAVLTRWWPGRPEPPPEPVPVAVGAAPHREAATPLVMGGALLALILVGTPLAMAAVGRPAMPARTCPDGRPADPLIGGTGVRVVADVARASRDVDQVGYVIFNAQLPLFAPVPGKHFVGMVPPWALIHGLTAEGTDRFAVVDKPVPAPRGSVLYLCGAVVHDPETDALFDIFPDPVDVYRGTPRPNP